MSLLQEMETYGMADCKFNRQLWKETENKILQLAESIEWQTVIIFQSRDIKQIERAKNRIEKMEQQINELKREL